MFFGKIVWINFPKRAKNKRKIAELLRNIKVIGILSLKLF
nr:MAG TPA: hypothetical protein [Caudoviricetes sp.]